MKYYLAVDIGASSGRHMLGHLEEGKMILEEVYRFENGMDLVDGHLCWNVNRLWNEVKNGMKKCAEQGKIPLSMGIDTWAVDYVLLDDQDQILGPTYGYRDERTAGMDEIVYEQIPHAELYGRNGIQKQIFNTIYQLQAHKRQQPKLLEQAKSMLMIPDWLHFQLTGQKATEYTNATTTQLVDPKTCSWDEELIEKLGFPKQIFQPIVKPGTILGQLRPEVAEEVGFQCEVIVPATHDTGSAVAALPSLEEDSVYISSGTWSLMGTELPESKTDMDSFAHNFTSEGGVNLRYRYLKNIMGLWMIQSLKKEMEDNPSYGEICSHASQQNIASLVDCNGSVFLAPASMKKAVQDYCRKTNQQIPATDWELAAVVYNSLAECYGKTLEELEEMTGKHYDLIYVIGGGSNADYLNEVTANATKRTVLAGVGEATAVGNLAVQMIADGSLPSLMEARRIIRDSFPIHRFEPKTA